MYHKILFLGFLPVIVTTGLVGNLALFVVVYRIKTMRNITNFYLCNLAVSDAALLIASTMQSLTTYYTTPIDTDLIIGIHFFAMTTYIHCVS